MEWRHPAIRETPAQHSIQLGSAEYIKKFKYNTSSLTVVKKGNIQVIIIRKTLTKQGNEINNCLTD